MKTTIELPDLLLRAAKANAAARGESLRRFFTEAVENHLAARNRVESGKEAWRELFGSVPHEIIVEIEAAIEEGDFERIEPDDEP